MTSLIKDFLFKNQPISYKGTAAYLVNQLVSGGSLDRSKEEKNVRRRVYDAINVLLAANVLHRDNKTIS